MRTHDSSLRKEPGRRRPALMLAIALLLGAAWTLRDGPAPSRGISEVAGIAENATPLPPRRSSRIRAWRSAGGLIQSYRVSPSRACAGDTVVVEVGLKRDIAARVSIEGRSGQRVAMTFPEAGNHSIHALAQGWEGGEDEAVTTVRVRDCPDRPRLRVSHDFATSEDDVVVFYVDETEGLQGTPTFRWRVDGQASVETEEGHLRHSVALRDQNGPTTSVVVVVEAIDERGITATGRHSVTLNNPLWLMGRTGELHLPVVAERFPHREGNDLVSEIQVRNPLDSAAVEVTGVEIVGMACEDADERHARWIDAPTALSSRRIAPHETLQADVRLPREIDGREMCTLEVRLHGRTDAGQTAQAAFLLEAGIHPGRSHPASAALARMGLRALVEAGATRVSDDEMKELLGDPRGEFDVLSR